MTVQVKGEYRISDKKSEMDLDAIHAYLSISYWSPNIPKSIVKKGIESSLCFGVFYEEQQVGFARAITDKATFAYLCDVYILEEHRGKGLSKKLMDKIISHSELQGLRRMLLATRDAHGLYKRYGFDPLPKPEIFMSKWVPEAYLNK